MNFTHNHHLCLFIFTSDKQESAGYFVFFLITPAETINFFPCSDDCVDIRKNGGRKVRF